jgi:hypothetical protein
LSFCPSAISDVARHAAAADDFRQQLAQQMGFVRQSEQRADAAERELRLCREQESEREESRARGHPVLDS